MSEIKDIAYKFGCGRYRQEAGLLDEAGDEITRFGRKAVIVGGKTALGLTKERLEKSLEKAGVEYRVVSYAGIAVMPVRTYRKEYADCDMVVGVGGGRIMDLAKLLACRRTAR